MIASKQFLVIKQTYDSRSPCLIKLVVGVADTVKQLPRTINTAQLFQPANLVTILVYINYGISSFLSQFLFVTATTITTILACILCSVKSIPLNQDTFV